MVGIKLSGTLPLRHLSPACRELLERAGDLCEVSVLEDPTYRISTELLAPPVASAPE